jgi:hypothetical protein
MEEVTPELKDNYSKLEVMETVARQGTKFMELLRDNKYFIVEGEEIVCYRKNLLFSDKELSRSSFEYTWRELWKK